MKNTLAFKSFLEHPETEMIANVVSLNYKKELTITEESSVFSKEIYACFQLCIFDVW